LNETTKIGETKMKKKMVGWIIAVVVVLILILIPALSRQKQPQEIKIGAILPLTGDMAMYGNNDKMGIDLAVEEINKSGGINGKMVQVLYQDNQGEAKTALSALQKLIQDGVFIVIDDAMSSITLSMVPVAKAKKIIIISTGATNPRLSGISPYFFRIWNSDAEEAIFMARYCLKEKINQILVLYVNNDYGKGLADAFSREFTKEGGRIVEKLDFDENSRDFKSIVARIKSYSPQYIYLVGYAAQTGIIVKQVRELGIVAKIIGTVAMEDAKFLQLAGKSAEGVIYPFPKEPTGESSRKFKELFKKKYNKEPELLSDVGYDAANLSIYAISKGTRNADDVRKIFLQMTDYEGASGIIKFDENGDVHKPMVIKEIRNGKFQLKE